MCPTSRGRYAPPAWEPSFPEEADALFQNKKIEPEVERTFASHTCPLPS